MVAGEVEIYGQRINAETGNELGGDIRLSTMCADGDSRYDAFSPALTYNSKPNEYFVIWSGSSDNSMLVTGEFVIYGQRIDAATARYHSFI